jgi:hypothetical protein
MYKNRFLFLAKIFLFLILNNFSIANCIILGDWAGDCFARQPEFAENNYRFLFEGKYRGSERRKDPLLQGVSTIVSSEEIDGLITRAIDFYQLRFTEAMRGNWLGAVVSTNNRYVQKLIVIPGSKVFFIGDIHGSVHSLLRNLLRLKKLGYLDDNLKLVNENTYIVFLGDYQNCGRYGVEVWYTVFTILLNNDPNRVILLKGNHENIEEIESKGFSDELRKKYKRASDLIKCKFLEFWDMLPEAVFLGFNESFSQCCHGGIEGRYSPNALLESSSEILYEAIEGGSAHSSDFINGNFYQDGLEKKAHRKGLTQREVIYFLSSNGGYSKVKVVIRGHQHAHHGCKLIPRIPSTDVLLSKSEQNDPIGWVNVLNTTEEARDGFTRDGFLLKDYCPVITLSSAPEGASYGHKSGRSFWYEPFNFDCIGILSIAEYYDNWRFLPYEIELERYLGCDHLPSRHRRFTCYCDNDRWRADSPLVDFELESETRLFRPVINDCLRLEWRPTSPRSSELHVEECTERLCDLESKCDFGAAAGVPASSTVTYSLPVYGGMFSALSIEDGSGDGDSADVAKGEDSTVEPSGTSEERSVDRRGKSGFKKYKRTYRTK